MAEFSQYNEMKDDVRAKLTKNASQPDIEKIKKDVQSEIEADFRKNKCTNRRFELTLKNSWLYLHIIKT